MSTLIRWSTVLVVAAAFFLANPGCAFACSCLPPGTPQEELGKSDAVFAGKVVQVSGQVDGGAAETVEVRFEVSQVWKGAESRTVLVKTPGSSASCGFNFEQGREYVVYASQQEGNLTSGLCSRTTLLASAADDLAVLGSGTAPSGEAETPATLPEAGSDNPAAQLPPYLLGVGALVIVGLALAFTARRRLRARTR